MASHPNPDEITISKADRVAWWMHGNTAIVVLLLVAALCVGGTFLYRPLFQTSTASSVTGASVSSSSDVIVPSSQVTGTYYFAWAPENQATDIYSVTTGISPTEPVNVTNTPGYAELWPVSAPHDSRLAFFLVSPKDERSLRVMSLGEFNVDATYNVGKSGLGHDYVIDLASPLQWSPDGVWIAFLGQTPGDKPSATELFVVDVAGSRVYRLTEGGNVVTTFYWSSPTEIIYNQRAGNEALAVNKISVVGLPGKVEPVKLGLIQP